MTKSIKFNSKNIINLRKDIDVKKKNNWMYIRTYNVVAKKEADKRKFDLKALYNDIMQMSEKLVLIKGMLFYLNMGETTFDKEKFKKTNNYNIFMATEMKEAIAQLKLIPTLDPATKSKKGGAAKMGKDEVFTSAKIASLIKELQLKAVNYDAAMEEFNTNTSIDITSVEDTFKLDLAA